MQHANLRKKVHVHARDFNETIFRKEDITMFLNEAIDRVIQVIPELEAINYLIDDEDYVEVMPRQYVHLLANYSAARLFAQDERHYEASTQMNEFELKLDELSDKIENGDIEITNPETGRVIESGLSTDYVREIYYFGKGGTVTRETHNNDAELDNENEDSEEVPVEEED